MASAPGSMEAIVRARHINFLACRIMWLLSLSLLLIKNLDTTEPLAKAPTIIISALAATKWRCCHPEVKMTKNAAQARLTPLWASATFSSFCGSTKSACAVLKSSKKAVYLSRFYQK